jgi:hypothetical protein
MSHAILPTPRPADAEHASISYDHDFYRWCFDQAELMRLGRFAEVDLPNIVEDWKSLGKSLRSSLTSSYRLVVAHLLKWQFQPQMRTASWEITIVRERGHIEDVEAGNRSLKSEAQALVDSAYRKARREAAIETGLPLTTFPAVCPYTLEQLRDDEWMPE